VLDEADKLLSPELRESIENLLDYCSENRQILLFSATFEEEEDEKEKDEEILRFASKIVPKPIKLILLPKEKLSIKAIKQHYISVKDLNSKFKALQRVFRELPISQCIIFVNTRELCNKLSEDLKKEKFTVSTIHGKMEPEDRKKVITDFTGAKTKLLISTDALARGIDIKQVTHVINYEMPISHQTGEIDPVQFLHRVGRSGRFGRSGIAINLVSSKEEISYIKDLENYFTIKIKEVSTDCDDLSEFIKN